MDGHESLRSGRPGVRWAPEERRRNLDPLPDPLLQLQIAYLLVPLAAFRHAAPFQVIVGQACDERVLGRGVEIHSIGLQPLDRLDVLMIEPVFRRLGDHVGCQVDPGGRQ